MDYTILGKTGIGSSVLGIGTGGPSRVGVTAGKERGESVRIVQLAIENGINFIDTAEAYSTESIVGEAIRGVPRETLFLSTKVSRWEDLDGAGLEAAVERRLAELGTDYIDVCHLHAVTAERYDEVVARLGPTLESLREAGTIRHIGITERFNADPGHEMLMRAVHDELWDVMMVGFNILNQSARDRVFPEAMRKGVGVLGMFAVRLALSRPERLREVVDGLIGAGQLDEQELIECGGSREDPLSFVTAESDAEDLVDAAYRFVRHEEAMHVTLSGTGSEEHLLANIESAQRPPLPAALVAKLRRFFRNVDSVTAQ